MSPAGGCVVTVADLRSLRHGDHVRLSDGTTGEVAFCAPSASYAPDFPVSEWPADRYDGLMVRDEAAGLVFLDVAGFGAGEASWPPEGAP